MSRASDPEVSVVIPAFNERECLPALLDEIAEALAGRRYEVIVVDDGSTDGTAELLDRRVERDPRMVVIHFARNAGQSAAFYAGFRRARAERIVTLDADGQNPPAEIPRLLDAMGEDVDLVAGYRAHRHDSAWRRFQSRVANAVRNALSGETIRDTGCSLKVFRARHLQELPLFDGMHRFLPTLCRLAGATRIIELPVAHRPRQGGRSKYGMWNRALRGLVDLLAVRWLQRRWVRYDVREIRSGEESPPASEAADRRPASSR